MTIKHIKLIDKKKYAKIMLHKNVKDFIMHVTSWLCLMSIHVAKKT